MKVSMKGDYGVRALVELAHRYGEGQVQSAAIANAQSIPEPYLDQLLTTLRRAGFIRSVRGPQGLPPRLPALRSIAFNTLSSASGARLVSISATAFT